MHTHAEDNAHAGRGASVLLDIGGEVGAAVVAVPIALLGAEVEARPVGAGRPPVHAGVVARPLPGGGRVPAVASASSRPARTSCTSGPTARSGSG